jgi:branched-chain amino acid transport system substrate-binding protein
MNIGILYPRSKMHSSLGFDFLDGLKACIKQQELNGQLYLFTESIAFGGTEKEVYEKAEKLLMIDGADVLLAYIDQRVIGVLTPLFYASGKLVVIINPGANYPINWIPQKNMVNLTLLHGFLCWLTGALAGKQKNPNAAMATTYYDCGYLHTAAMVKNLLKAGGNITFNYVNRQPYDDTFDIDQLTEFLSGNNGTRNLLCIFDSLPASLFYKRLNHFAGAGELQLFVSAMMLEQKALEDQGGGFKFSIEGYVPWLISVENEANRSFTDFYRQEVKRLPSVFSLLGWEAGIILQQVLLLAHDDYTNGAAIAAQLTHKSLNTPRGELKLDPVTQYFIAPVGKCSVKKHSGKLEVEWISNFENDWKAFVDEPTEGIVSGWMNTYLCY